MIIKRGSKFIAALLTLISVITVAWLSCTKVGANLHTCNGIICENGGYCHVDTFTKKPICLCPTGYEGTNCAIISIDKYIGTWDMTQVTLGSDSVAFNNYVAHYVVLLKQTATPTTFFITNFSNDLYYNSIICTMDSINTSNFIIDTISAYHLLFDHYKLVSGSGSISVNDSLIKANLITRHLSATSNWINDTFSLTMTPHKF